MSELSETTQPEIRDERPPEATEKQVSSGTAPSLRFHLLLNAFLMVSGTAILKMDGPYYADAVVAGMFAVSSGISLYSFRLFRTRERATKRRIPATSLFLLFSVFFLATAFAIIWFTFIVPLGESTGEDGGVARAPFSFRSEAC